MSSELRLRRAQSAHETVVTSQLRTSGREQLILSYREGENWVEGEASPLNGFGHDDIERAHLCLSALKPLHIEQGVRLLSERFSHGESCMNVELWREITELFACESPSARFCWEMLCARVAAQRCGVSLFRLLCGDIATLSLATSQVLDPLATDFFERAEHVWGQGVRTFKLKCGRALHQELDSIFQLCRLFEQQKDALYLRIDANRGFDMQAALTLIQALREMPVEWYEDLTSDPFSWQDLRVSSSLLAVDEPLVEYGSAAASVADVLVIKPMALGGFSSSLELCSFAVQHEKQVVVSHLFDGALAFEATVALAFCVQTVKGAAGLSLHAGLEGDDNARFPWLFPDRMIVPNNS